MAALEKFIVCTPVLNGFFDDLYGCNLSAIKRIDTPARSFDVDAETD